MPGAVETHGLAVGVHEEQEGDPVTGSTAAERRRSRPRSRIVRAPAAPRAILDVRPAPVGAEPPDLREPGARLRVREVASAAEHGSLRRS